MISSDYQLAKVLQEQFQNEIETDESAKRLTYKQPNKHNLNSSKCLVDPSWEVIDPTPDIHILFMAFNERFFWNKLLAVCVSWSKRMTTCAGICSYQGRGGMCSITLSEPLLKLRPRKDLVETLLHEMIHAYLFVTHNNRDRDGHGPEFHKHMYRINAESGTNITVYHDFHDEVRLYKQHWWRCNGPCRSWKPYYGLVKRAMNRAPGPTDRWWAEHSARCGGEFIKVKEPEKPAKPTKSNSSTKSKPNLSANNSTDIRKHFSPTNNANPSKTKSDVVTITDLTSPKKDYASQPTRSKSSSLTTIQDLTSPDKNNDPTNTNRFPDTPGRKLSDSSVPNNDYASVRDHWLNKFSSNNKTNLVRNSSNKDINSSRSPQCSSTTASSSLTSSPSSSTPTPSSPTALLGSSTALPSSSNKLKRVLTDDLNYVPNKLPRLDMDNSNLVECPVCSEKVSKNDLNDHLDECLTKTKECIICTKNIPQAEYSAHVTDCCNSTFADDVTEVPPYEGNSPATPSIIFEVCTVCDKSVESPKYVRHLQSCVESMYDNLEKKYKLNSTECPVCDKSVAEGELGKHLEVCQDLSEVFEDEECVITRIDDENKENKCPVCSELVKTEEMNTHINLCLDISNDSSL